MHIYQDRKIFWDFCSIPSGALCCKTSTLTMHCQWYRQAVRERTGHSPTDAEAKKVKEPHFIHMAASWYLLKGLLSLLAYNLGNKNNAFFVWWRLCTMKSKSLVLLWPSLLANAASVTSGSQSRARRHDLGTSSSCTAAARGWSSELPLWNHLVMEFTWFSLKLIAVILNTLFRCTM